jgi:hypothetical protein
VNNVYTQQTRYHPHKDGAVENVVKSSRNSEGEISTHSWLSVTSGFASNPASREIASSSGASVHQDILFFRFFSIFF